MSWPWIVLLVLAAAVVVAAEWTRVAATVGTAGRHSRRRQRQKASMTLISGDADSDTDEFAQSVQRDLDSLPTIDEPRSPR